MGILIVHSGSRNLRKQTANDYQRMAIDQRGTMDVIPDTVDIIEVMKPVCNFKAAEDQVTWKKKTKVTF